MSVNHACNLAALLNISLDWLLMGRNGPDWLHPNQLSELERDLLAKLRERPARIVKLLIGLTAEMPRIPVSEHTQGIQLTVNIDGASNHQ